MAHMSMATPSLLHYMRHKKNRTEIIVSQEAELAACCQLDQCIDYHISSMIQLVCIGVAPP